jgi:phenylalanine-4-hydroxylase
LILDMSIMDYYNITFFLKKNTGFSITEMDGLLPFELEIYYYMAIKEKKEELGIK